MNNETSGTGIPQGAKDSARVKRYHRTGRILSVAGYLVDLALLLTFLFAGWTVALRTLALHYSPRPWLALLIYLVLFGTITQLVGLPFSFLQGFWLEHRYGLSNLTLAGWVKDQWKGLAVGGTLAVLGVEFLYAMIRRWPERWWALVRHRLHRVLRPARQPRSGAHFPYLL
jgi:STE24 endopeptidase